MTHITQPLTGGYLYFTEGVLDGALSIGGTWTAYSTWTLPAFTLGGTITSNGQSFSGTIANLGTVTTADIDGGTIDGATIGGVVAAAGTFTTVGATTGNITTVNATTVDTTNIEVTNLKAKDGTTAGSIADTTGVVTLASSVLTTADINGGTIDGATIGGATPAAGTFTTLTANGDVTLGDASADTVTMNAGIWDAPASGGRIQFRLGDATRANRTMFMNRTLNEGSNVGVIPNGTNNVAAWTAFSSSDPDNSHFINIYTTSTGTFLNSGIAGTGTQRALALQIGGASKVTIDTAGDVTSTGVHLGPDGSASAPTYSFASSGNTDNGMYLSAANVLSFAIAGAKTATIQADRLEFASGYHVSSATATGTTPAIQSGNSTLTVTAGTNVSSVTTPCNSIWDRNCRAVSVVAYPEITTAASGGALDFYVALPIASNLANTYNLLGFAIGNGYIGTVLADTTNDRAIITLPPGAATGTTYSVIVMFKYEVL